MGAPIGNQFAVKSKRWSMAIDAALEARSKRDGVVALEALAEKLLTLAEQGDLGALRELGDRIEGKPAQGVTVSGDPDAPLVSKVVREIVHAKHQDS